MLGYLWCVHQILGPRGPIRVWETSAERHTASKLQTNKNPASDNHVLWRSAFVTFSFSGRSDFCDNQLFWRCDVLTFYRSVTKGTYVWVSDQSSIPMFCLKKLISQPREVQNPPNLTQGTLTQYILRLVIFRPHPTPPICLKMPKCVNLALSDCPMKKIIYK